MSGSILSPLSYAAGLVLTCPLTVLPNQLITEKKKNLPGSFHLYMAFLLETNFMYILPLDSHTGKQMRYHFPSFQVKTRAWGLFVTCAKLYKKEMTESGL